MWATLVVLLLGVGGGASAVDVRLGASPSTATVARALLAQYVADAVPLPSDNITMATLVGNVTAWAAGRVVDIVLDLQPAYEPAPAPAGFQAIPFAWQPIAIVYNVPGVSQRLALSLATLRAIFAGNATTWDDARVVADNPGVALPSARRIAAVVVPAELAAGFAQFLQVPSLNGTTTAAAGGASVVAGTAYAIGFADLDSATRANLSVAAFRSVTRHARASPLNAKGPDPARSTRNAVGLTVTPDDLDASPDGSTAVVDRAMICAYPILSTVVLAFPTAFDSCAVADEVVRFAHWVLSRTGTGQLGAVVALDSTGVTVMDGARAIAPGARAITAVTCASAYVNKPPPTSSSRSRRAQRRSHSVFQNVLQTKRCPVGSQLLIAPAPDDAVVLAANALGAGVVYPGRRAAVGIRRRC